MNNPRVSCPLCRLRERAKVRVFRQRVRNRHDRRGLLCTLVMAMSLAACAATAPPPPETRSQIAVEPVIPSVIAPIARAKVIDHYAASYDIAHVPVGAIAESAAAGKSVVHVAGSVRQRVYQLPDNIPRARAHTYYHNTLQNDGFTLLLDCLGAAACGAGFGHYVNAGGPVVKPALDYSGYAPYAALTAHRAESDGETYAFIYLGAHDRRRVFYQIVTIGSLPLPQTATTVPAARPAR